MRKMLAMILAAMMILAAVTCGASAEEWKDFFCEEEQFSTKVPASGTTRYEAENGGLVVYTEHDGYIPNLTVHRRSGENKFKNPTNYLNNVYREIGRAHV